MNNNRKELELPVKPFNEMEDAFINRAIFFKDLKPMLSYSHSAFYHTPLIINTFSLP